jgi:hypothetical protein
MREFLPDPFCLVSTIIRIAEMNEQNKFFLLLSYHRCDMEFWMDLDLLCVLVR